MKPITNYRTADKQSEAMRRGALYVEVINLIDSAWQNASDTLAEGSITEDQIDVTFIESLKVLLSGREASKRAVKWFATRGVVA
jgi:hypothetical protein